MIGSLLEPGTKKDSESSPEKFVDCASIKSSSKLFLVKVSKPVQLANLNSLKLDLKCGGSEKDQQVLDSGSILNVNVHDFDRCPSRTSKLYRIITKKDDKSFKLVSNQIGGLISIANGLKDLKDPPELIVPKKVLITCEELVKEASQTKTIEILQDPIGSSLTSVCEPIKKSVRVKKEPGLIEDDQDKGCSSVQLEVEFSEKRQSKRKKSKKSKKAKHSVMDEVVLSDDESNQIEKNVSKMRRKKPKREPNESD